MTWPSHDPEAPVRALAHLVDPASAPLFEELERLGVESAWWGHVPFARWLIAACAPRVLVELGTHHGVSYAAFCAAVLHERLDTACHAVDTGLGDHHARRYGEDVFEGFRAYHDARYAAFSTVHRCTFDEARPRFAPGSVDVLHLDGLHTLQAVRHDFELWLPTLSDRGVVLLHDVDVRRDDVGVWQLWAELRGRYPSFQFHHAHGLGVLAVGAQPPLAIAALCAHDATPEGDVLRARFAQLGARWVAEAEKVRLERTWRHRDDEAAQRTKILAQEVRAAHEQARGLRAHAADLERQLVTAGEEVAELRARIEAAGRAHGAAMHAQLTELQRLRAIEEGAIWRATGPLRRWLDRHPSLRSLLRRGARGVWWAATGQLPSRLRGWWSRRAGDPAAPLVATAPYAAATLPTASTVAGGEPVMIVPFEIPPPTPRQRVAVLLHAYHVDLASDVHRRLAGFPTPFALFVSTDTAEKAEQLRRVFADGPAARVTVRVFPNRGRDVAPKLLGFRDVIADFDVVLHLHTKRSSHEAALASWRDAILDDLLGSPEAIASILAAFEQQPRLGIVAPRTFPAIRRHLTWGPNFPLARYLAQRLGIALEIGAPLDFPAGSMFYARGAALAPLLDAGLTLQDFPEEAGQRDATLAHAIERLFFFVCERAGYRWIRAGSDRGILAPETPWRVYGPSSLDFLASDQLPSLLLPGLRPNPTGVPPAASCEAEELRASFRAQCAEDLDTFLARGDRLAFDPSPEPRVSVILLLFDQAELTLHCLASLHADHPTADVVILDNASTDRTAELLQRVDGATILRSPENLHFVRGVNHAAAHARGAYLLLLNNDTRVASGAVAAAAERLDAEADLGAVGGPIVQLGGMLQEAGSIIWRDGSTAGYGRGRDPGEPEFQFRRDVDYCSAAFLMVRRSLFERLGGFDEAFAPAYHEETDLCMRLRAEGYRVAYEPRARIAHLEFGSGGSESAFVLQGRNRATFLARHRATLDADHAPVGTPLLFARSRDRAARRVLIVDDRVPCLALGSGSPRARAIVAELADAGWAVTLLPYAMPYASFEEAYRAVPASVEIAAGIGPAGLAAFLRSRVGFYDVAIVGRPHNMAAFHRACGAAPAFAEGTPIIYDAEAIFASRDAIRAEVHGDALGRAAAAHAMSAELGLARGAAALFAVNEAEAERFRAVTPHVHVLGHSVAPRPVGGGPQGRAGLLFVGALDEDDSPNVDSLVWFVEHVMPRLDALVGDGWSLRAIGSHASVRVRRLASPRVRLLGRTEEIDDHYAQARAFVAPTRFAAGIPLKVLEAAGKGLPVIATPLLGGQLGWTEGEELVAAADPDAFAAACARLMQDDALWTRLRLGALRAVARDGDPDRFRSTLLNAVAAVSGGARRFVAPT